MLGLLSMVLPIEKLGVGFLASVGRGTQFALGRAPTRILFICVLRSSMGQERFLYLLGHLDDLALLRMSIQKKMLRDKDEVEKDTDVPEPQLDRIANHSAPVGLKAGVDQ
jgi:hypothetical protein